MKKQLIVIIPSTNTSKQKQLSISFTKLVLLILVTSVLGIFLLKYSINFLSEYTQNSKIAKLRKENQVLQAELGKMTQTISLLRENIDYIEKKDDQLRTILDLPKINEEVRQVGIGGTELNIPNKDILSDFSLGNDLVENLKVLKQLEREIRLEKDSYQQLITTLERRQDSVRYLPAIRPVHNAYLSSSFGNRFHPILHKNHFHKGVDLATNKGTPVYATADGYVTFAGLNGGFGRMVEINHKYGFVTYYGHLNKIYVRKGQFVKRGEKIGEVGKTGLATNTHLHYEVRYKGKPINPLSFFLDESEFYKE